MHWDIQIPCGRVSILAGQARLWKKLLTRSIYYVVFLQNYKGYGKHCKNNLTLIYWSFNIWWIKCNHYVYWFFVKARILHATKRNRISTVFKKMSFVFSRHSTFLPLSFLAAGHKSWGRLLWLLCIVPQPKVPLLRSSINNNILSWLIVHL